VLSRFIANNPLNVTDFCPIDLLYPYT
jgi:hypothetical protein